MLNQITENKFFRIAFFKKWRFENVKENMRFSNRMQGGTFLKTHNFKS
jgi:hypothetical protein